MGMPVGALVAGPLAVGFGVSATQYGAAGIMVIASALTLISRDIRTMRADSVVPVLVPAERVTEPVLAEPAPVMVKAEPDISPTLAGKASLAASQAR
jgi:hypothetical protein